MRFLIDENLPVSLIRRVADIWPACAHVKDLGLLSASDTRIWEQAKSDHMTILTKDHDFYVRATLFGPPPQIVWLQMGNCSIDKIEILLRRNAPAIERFANATNWTMTPREFCSRSPHFTVQ